MYAYMWLGKKMHLYKLKSVGEITDTVVTGLSQH